MVAARDGEPQPKTLVGRVPLAARREEQRVGQPNRPDEAFAGSSSEAARARERMAAAQGGSQAISARSRRIVGWTIAVLIIGFFVAAFTGWIDVLPG